MNSRTTCNLLNSPATVLVRRVVQRSWWKRHTHTHVSSLTPAAFVRALHAWSRQKKGKRKRNVLSLLGELRSPAGSTGVPQAFDPNDHARPRVSLRAPDGAGADGRRGRANGHIGSKGTSSTVGGNSTCLVRDRKKVTHARPTRSTTSLPSESTSMCHVHHSDHTPTHSQSNHPPNLTAAHSSNPRPSCCGACPTPSSILRRRLPRDLNPLPGRPLHRPRHTHVHPTQPATVSRPREIHFTPPQQPEQPPDVGRS